MASSDRTELNSVREDGLLREELIGTAVKFLQNPKVSQSPLATRKAFLKKKGLSDEEVELAIQRSACVEEPLARGSTSESPRVIQSPLVAPVSHSAPGYRWRDYGALAIIMAGMTFGFHHLYNKYILPLIMGSKEDKKHLQRIESSIIDMNGTLTQTVTQLQITLTSVQELLVQQQKSIHELSHDQANIQTSTSASSHMLESQSISELKAEIASLKGLLLSRRQFPASPSLPKIPSWQIPLKTGTVSNPPSVNHTNSSSDISPVSNESTSSSPIKEGNCAITPGMQDLNGETDMGSILALNLKDQPQKKVQGEEKRNDEEELRDDENDVIHVSEVEDLSVSKEDRRGGDGEFNKHVEKLLQSEGVSNESEVD